MHKLIRFGQAIGVWMDTPIPAWVELDTVRYFYAGVLGAERTMSGVEIDHKQGLITLQPGILMRRDNAA